MWKGAQSFQNMTKTIPIITLSEHMKLKLITKFNNFAYECIEDIY